jgi:hypothetical protein
MRFIAAVLTLCLSFGVHAQTVSGKLDLNWTLPTVGCTQGVTPCDGVPLAAGALTGINVYISTSPIPDNFTGPPTLTLGSTSTTTTHTMQVANGTTLYARVRATAGINNPSPFSNQVSKLVTLTVAPNAPTNLTITLTIGVTP